MGRHRKHATNKARQKAYRDRVRNRKRKALVVRLSGNSGDKFMRQHLEEYANLSLRELRRLVKEVPRAPKMPPKEEIS
jgi:hypothetical protein